MHKYFLFLVAILFSCPAAVAFPHGGGAAIGSIGGIGIGATGAPGTIYAGYTLAGGDDFNNALNVVTVNAPNAPYFSTKVYSTGARTVNGTTGLATQYDSDPFYTGAQDSKRGIAVGSTNMSQSGGILSLQARIANSGETPYIATRTYVTSMIHTGGYISATPPAIFEARIKYPSGTQPNGWHPTFWLENASPLNVGTATGALEFDMESNSATSTGTVPTGFNNNINVHGTVAGWTTQTASGNEALFDGNYHILSMILTSTSIQYYVDGTLKSLVSGDTTVTALPYYMLFTNHIIAPTVPNDWVTLGATGATQAVDWYRIWIPSGNYPADVLTPSQALPTLQAAYNTSITYNFPSATTLWGAGVADYCQGIKFEDYEPGSNGEGIGNYVQFPTGETLTGRVLTGITSDMQPGRIHTSCTANIPGGSANYVARGYIDIGPVITTGSLTATHGTPFSYDVYPDANVGTLVPKVLSVTGLPTDGLSFSPTTGLITGTPISATTINLTVGVTNFSGQTATKNVTLTVN